MSNMRDTNDMTDACNAGVCDTGCENCTVVSRKANNMNDTRNYADQPVRLTNGQQFLVDDSDNKVVDETDYISEVSNLIDVCGTDDSKKATLPVKHIGDMEVTVIPAGDPLIRKAAEEQILSDHDKQMDIRAKAAVRTVLERARVCGNAVAKYDKETKTAYLEYPDGTREDVL